MEIQEVYSVQIQDVTITYLLKDQLEDLEILDRIDAIRDNKDLSDKDKRIKVFEIALEDLQDIKGLTKGGKEITIEEVKALKIPAVHIDMLIKAYTAHKRELATGITAEQAAKND